MQEADLKYQLEMSKQLCTFFSFSGHGMESEIGRWIELNNKM